MRETNHVKFAPNLSFKLREFIEQIIIINKSGYKEDKIISQVKNQVKKLLETNLLRYVWLWFSTALD